MERENEQPRFVRVRLTREVRALLLFSTPHTQQTKHIFVAQGLDNLERMEAASMLAVDGRCAKLYQVSTFQHLVAPRRRFGALGMMRTARDG